MHVCVGMYILTYTHIYYIHRTFPVHSSMPLFGGQVHPPSFTRARCASSAMRVQRYLRSCYSENRGNSRPPHLRIDAIRLLVVHLRHLATLSLVQLPGLDLVEIRT